MSLSPDQIKQLHNEGYILASNAVDDTWRAPLLRTFEGAPHASGTQHIVVDETMEYYNEWEALKQLPEILEAADKILGRAFRVRDLHGRNPLPGFGQQGLHADWPQRRPEQHYMVVSAIFMLDDFTLKNGATRLIPGSHRITKPLAKSYVQPQSHHPEEKIISGSAGSVLIFNGHLWHSGTRNCSQTHRRAAQMVIVAD